MSITTTIIISTKHKESSIPRTVHYFEIFSYEENCIVSKKLICLTFKVHLLTGFVASKWTLDTVYKDHQALRLHWTYGWIFALNGVYIQLDLLHRSL